MSFSDNVYRIMQERKMSQAAVAKGAGMSPQAFNNILKGRKLLREEYVFPICRSLGVTPNDLFTDDRRG